MAYQILLTAMRITFVLPQLELYGGIKSSLQLAEALQELGHDVSVVYPMLPGRDGQPFWNLRKTLVQIVKFCRALILTPSWFHFSGKLIKAPYRGARFLPEADLLVLTWWDDVAKYHQIDPRYGKPIHFARSYELWGGPADKVAAVYALDIPRVTNSEQLARQLPKAPMAVVPNGLDEVFFETSTKAPRTVDTPLRIGILYRLQDWKRMSDAITVLKNLKATNPALEILVFGEAIKAEDKFAMQTLEPYEYHHLPAGPGLRQLFEKLDIFLFTSDETEAFGNPPLEAMAAGCAVVTTRVGGIPEFSSHEVNALHCEPRDCTGLTASVQRLIDDPDLRARLAAKAQVDTKDRRWKNTALQFLAAVEQLDNSAAKIH